MIHANLASETHELTINISTMQFLLLMDYISILLIFAVPVGVGVFQLTICYSFWANIVGVAVVGLLSHLAAYLFFKRWESYLQLLSKQKAIICAALLAIPSILVCLYQIPQGVASWTRFIGDYL